MQSDDQPQPTRDTAISDLMRAEHARLEALLAGVSDERSIEPGAFGAWSVKDMLAHITFWEQRLVAYINGARESLIRPGEDEAAAIDRINAGVGAGRIAERGRSGR